MEPLTAAAIESAVETTVATGAETDLAVATGAESDLAVDPDLESAAETLETRVNEQGLLPQLDAIRFDSVESLIARNNETFRSEVSQIEANRECGAAREKAVAEELEREYPQEDGYTVESQRPLCDESGNIVKDPETGETRRIDFVVIKDGEVVKSIEVTSETADKTPQLAKEQRIRDAGGDYVIDRETGDLVRFAPDVKTEVERRP